MPTDHLPPRLRAYCDGVRRTVGAGPVGAEAIAELRESAARLAEEPLELAPEQRALPGEGYGRNLLYRDPEFGFVVIAMVWPADVQGRPHDHGTWGVVVVAEGRVEITDYALAEGTGEGAVRLTELGRVVGGPGATGFVLPPDQDVHRIRNASREQAAISIHTYGRDITRCRLFDDASGEITWVEPRYHVLPLTRS